MSRILYCQRFFSTEGEARQFIKEHSGQGILYKNTPHSRSKREFQIEVTMSDLTQAELQDKDYCVAWNQRL